MDKAVDAVAGGKSKILKNSKQGANNQWQNLYLLKVLVKIC
jgi:hypothetical protein